MAVSDSTFQRVIWGLWLLLLGLQIHAVHAVDYLPTNDGPQHLLTTVVHQQYHTSPLGFDETWVLNEPLTDHGYREVCAFFLSFMGWQSAHKAAIDVALFLQSLGWMLLLRLCYPRRLAMGLLLAGLTISLSYWIGLLPFTFSLSFIPWLLLVDRRLTLDSVLGRVVFAGLLVVQVQVHPFAPALVGATLAVAALLAREWRRAVTLAVCGAPAALLALYISSQSDPPTHQQFNWELDLDVIVAFFGEYLPGSGAHQAALAVLVVGALALCARHRTEVRGAERWLLVLAVIGVLLSPLAPDDVPGWELVGVRLMPIALPLVLLLTPIEKITRLRAVPVIVFFCFSATHFLFVADLSRRIEAHTDDVYQSLRRALPTLTGKTWDLHFYAEEYGVGEFTIPHFGSYGHMAQSLAIEKGGRPRFSHAGDAALHGLLYPPTPPTRHLGQITGNRLGEWGLLWSKRADLDERALFMAGLLSHTSRVDALFVVALPSDRALLERAGFAVTSLGATQSGNEVFSLEPRGCDVTLELLAPVADVIELGVAPKPSAIEAFAIPAGRSTLTLDDMPCGRWWLRTELGCNGQRGEGLQLADVAGATTLTCVDGAPPRPPSP